MDKNGVSKSMSRAWLQTDRRTDRLEGAEKLGWLASTPAEDAVLIYEAQTDLFVSACELEAATYVYFETSAGLTARHAVVEDDGQWSSHILDEFAFSLVNEGTILVYWPRKQRYNAQNLSTSTLLGRVSVQCWG